MSQIQMTTLSELYWQEGMSTRDIARHLQCDDLFIYRLMKKYGIPLRSQGESLRTPRYLESLSKRNQGKNNPRYGRPLGQDVRERISQSRMCLNPKWRVAYQKRARKIWAKNYGTIPAGMVIHHRDGNYKNNSLDNLQMVTFTQHMRIHKGKETS